MVRAALIALIVALLPTGANAAPRWAEDVGTGRWIADTCDSRDTENFLVCAGYLRGIIDGHAFMTAAFQLTPAYCVPANFDYEQGRRIVAKFGEDNPKFVNDTAGILVVRALIDAFPCSK